MKTGHIEWFKNNIEEVNELFGINLKSDTRQDMARCELCIDIYDTEQDFNNAFEGVYDNEEYAFELSCEEGYAGCINGKYIYFNEVNY